MRFSVSLDHFLLTFRIAIGMQICRRISDTNNEIMALIFEMCYPCHPCIGVNLFKLSPLSCDLKRKNDANNFCSKNLQGYFVCSV